MPNNFIKPKLNLPFIKNARLIIALSLAYNLSVLNSQDFAANNLIPF